MSNLDTDLDAPYDPVDFIRQDRRRVVGEAITSLGEDDPVKAGRAYQLGRATGDKPALIYPDIENYETQHRAGLTANLLENNAYLREYLTADPMRAKLSGDDWANLDDFTGKLSAFRKTSHDGILGMPTRAVDAAWMAAWKGFREGIGEGPIGGWADTVPQMKDDRLAKSLWATVGTPVEVPFRLLAGVIHGATEATKAGAEVAYTGITGDAQGGSRFARDLAGIVEQQMTGQGVHGAFGDATAFVKYAQSMRKAKLWLDNGVEPPKGIDPLIDRAKKEQNDADVGNLEDVLGAAEKSATRQRDPATFADLVRMRDKGTIAIDADAVLRLYGDKPPMPEDGLLGWAPRIGEQIELARVSGADVEIPLAEWLAYADGDLMKLVRDDMRVRPGGITKNEALRDGGAGEAEVNAVRDAAATDLAAKSGETIEAGGEAGPKDAQRAALKPKGGEGEAKADPIVEEFLKARRDREIIPDDLPSIRAAGGLEPLFSIGDRKLKVERRPVDPERQKRYGDALLSDEFRLLDENGKGVGWLEVVPYENGTRLYIDNVGGFETKGYGPNAFGNSLTRDIARQLKELYPNATHIGGFRISGAREKAGTTREVWIKFDEAMDPQAFRDVLEGGRWKTIGQGLEVYQKTIDQLSLRELELTKLIEDELNRITPLKVDVSTPSAIRKEGSEQNIRGVHMQYTDRNPFIIIALDGRDPIGTARHEAVHHLRQQGFIDATEWDVLSRAARDNGWIEKFKIENRYSKLKPEQKLEEAIAEGYRDWKEGQPVPKAAETIFEKIKEMFERLKQRIAEFLWKERKEEEQISYDDLTWEQLFKEIDRGDIGSRERTTPLSGEAYRESVEEFRRAANDNIKRKQSLVDQAIESDKATEEKYIHKDTYKEWSKALDDTAKELMSVINKDGLSEFEMRRVDRLQQRWDEIFERGYENFEPKFSVDEVPPPLFRTPGTIGMTERQAALYERRIREMHESDVEWASTKAERQQRKEQSAEWRTEKKNVRAEVEADFDQRPDVAADLFFARGELYGEKGPKPKIDPADVPAELKASLPKDWFAKEGKEAVNLEDVASLTGYPTARAMLEDLARYNQAKLAANMSAKAFRDRMVDLEVDRRMADRFGNLEENILDAAKDQVAGETQLNLIAEETLALGIRADTEAPIKKAEIREWLAERFEESPMAGQSSDKYLKAAGKAGTNAEIGLLKEKFDEAYRAKQQQYYAMILMRDARTLEKEQKSLAKTAKRLAKREVKGLDQETHDWIQTLMWQAGMPSRRSLPEIQRSQAMTGADTFPEFVERMVGDGWAPDVALEIVSGRVKPMAEMTVGEFREFKSAIDSLNYIGRQTEKINIEGEKRDFAEWREGVVANIQSRPQRARESQESGIAHRIFQADAEMTRIENWMKELDLGEEMGPLVNTIIRPMAEAKHKEYSLQEKLSTDIKALPQPKEWKRTLDEAIPNTWFKDPSTGEPFKLTRNDLIGLMLNMGNRSNIQKVSRGYGSPDPTRGATRAEAEAFGVQMKEYIDAHATKADWDFVQGVWDIYKGFQKDMEVVWRNTSGTQPKLVETVEVDTPHGRYAGGYYPLLRDWYLSGTPKGVSDRALFGPDYPNYSTPQGHLKERTGASYFIDFRQPLGNIPLRMQQVMHDIAYRDAVMSAQKVISDKQIMASIRQHYGAEYEVQLRPWLERIAKAGTMDEANLNFRDKVLRQTRMNLVNYALPFNYVVLATPDVGAASWKGMSTYLRDKSANDAIANQWSKEIPHAIYNMDRDFREAMQRAVAEGKLDQAKAKAVRWGYGPVSWVSKQFRTATFIEEFNKARASGMDDAKAAAVADSYVRERHATASIADLPPIMASGEAGRLLTMFYGYWNTQFNWLRTAKGDVERGEYMKAVQTAYGTIIIGSAFGAAIANQAREEDTALKRAVKAVPLQLLGMVPYGVREATTYAFEGIPPRSPTGSAIQAAGATVRDIYKAFKKEPVEKGIRHTTATLGMLFGIPGTLQLGRTGQGIYDVSTGKQRPRDFMEWVRLVTTGEARLKRQGER